MPLFFTMVKSFNAAPCGLRTLRSHALILFLLTFKISANAAWVISPACWELGFQAWAQSTCPELSAQGLVPLRWGCAKAH